MNRQHADHKDELLVNRAAFETDDPH